MNKLLKKNFQKCYKLLTLILILYTISYYKNYGTLAQLVEHTAHIRMVIGSIPMGAKLFKAFFFFIRKYAFLF